MHGGRFLKCWRTSDKNKQNISPMNHLLFCHSEKKSSFWTFGALTENFEKNTHNLSQSCQRARPYGQNQSNNKRNENSSTVCVRKNATREEKTQGKKKTTEKIILNGK